MQRTRYLLAGILRPRGLVKLFCKSNFFQPGSTLVATLATGAVLLVELVEGTLVRVDPNIEEGASDRLEVDFERLLPKEVLFERVEVEVDADVEVRVEGFRTTEGAEGAIVVAIFWIVDLINRLAAFPVVLVVV